MPNLKQLALVVATLASQPSFAVTELMLEQDLGGVAQQSLKALAARFNGAQHEYRVNVADWQQGSKPHMALLKAPEGATLLEATGQVRPLHQVMSQAGERFDSGAISPALAVSVSDTSGKPMALPMAYAAPVMYYNRAIFRRVGLNPDKPPRTWIELQEAAGAMFDAGVSCPYSSSDPAWVHVENASTLNSESFAHGTGGSARVNFNALAQVRHLAMMTSWVKGRYFQVFGRGGEAEQRFAKGECAVLTSSSASFPDFKRGSSVEFGIAPVPIHEEAQGTRSALPDGAALWVLNGKSAAEYKGVAQFVAFLMQARNQSDWVASTGYLPVLRSISISSDGEASPSAILALREMTGARPLPLAAQMRVRGIVNEELDSVWANRKPPKEGLDVAVQRANLVLASGGVVYPAAAPVVIAAASAASVPRAKIVTVKHSAPAKKK